MNEEIEKKGYPDRYEAEALLREAEALNPGPWGNHSRVAAKCAETIAMACGDMNSEKAYVLGLLHDIGRRFGVKHLGHVYDGYIYMQELGYPQAARICLTHSFSTRKLTDYIGHFDVTPEQQQAIDNALSECVYDDYDRLIQLCDAISLPDGAVAMEERMEDVKRRYGHYSQEKWNKNIELKEYFSDKAKCDIEKLTNGIMP